MSELTEKVGPGESVVDPNHKDADESGDARILPVLLDSGGERWRRLDEAIPDMRQREFEDW
eukprot:12428901-Karenia_brevis.AAC.1